MLRTLSILETFYINQDITIITISDLKGKINPLTLQEAIKSVVSTHPLLCSEVQETDDGYIFVKRESFNDQCIIHGEISKDKRKEMILAELNTPLTKTNLIRFTLLLEERIGIIEPQHISLLMTTHHAVSDAMSCVALQEQIWKVYAELALNESPTLPAYPLMPAIENLITKSFTEDELADYVERYSQYQKQHKPFSLEVVDQGDSAIDIHFVTKKFTILQTKSIIDRCKENTVSVHDAICAANLLALRDLYGIEGKIELSCYSPIDIRSRLEPALPNNAMLSAAIGYVDFVNTTSDTTLWTMSSDVSASINHYISSGDIYKSALTLDKTKLITGAPISIGITNVGEIDISKKIRKLKLVAINFITRPPIDMLTANVTISGDKLTITYPFAKPSYSTNAIKKIAEAASRYLLG